MPGPSNDKGFTSQFDDFLGPTLLTQWTGTSENSGTSAINAGAEDGTARLVTGASNGNRSIITGGLNWYAQRGGPLFMEARISPITAVTTVGYFVGFTSSISLAFPIISAASAASVTVNTNDSVGVLFDTLFPTLGWYGVGAKGANATIAYPAANGVSAAAATYQTIRVELDQNGGARFFIDGRQIPTGVPTGGSLQNAVTNNTLITPIVAIITRTTAARTLDIDYIEVQKGRNAVGG